MAEHGNTQTWKKSESMEEMHKVGNETGDPEEGQIQQVEGEDTAVEEEQAEVGGAADNDDDKSSSTIPKEETPPIDDGGEPEAHADYARLNRYIRHLGRQIKIFDLDSASKLDDIHELLLENYDQIHKNSELLDAIHVRLGIESVGRQSPPREKRKGSPATPGAPTSKRVSSRPPLGAEYREQYGL